jgi:cbb3-type cytochrome oxidase subunit 3
MDYVYLIFGAGLVIALLLAIVHYYSKGRKQEVEEAKYRMLEDDD